MTDQQHVRFDEKNLDLREQSKLLVLRHVDQYVFVRLI